MTKGKMVDFIEKLNPDELRTLNKLVIQKIHETSREIALSFRKGDKVYFNDRRGKRHEGKVERVNRKNITVFEEASKTNPYPITWSVSPMFLNRVDDGNKQ